MPIAQPDRTKGSIADNLEGRIRAGRACMRIVKGCLALVHVNLRTALGTTVDKLVVLDGNGGYADDRDGFLLLMVRCATMAGRLGLVVLGGAVLDVVLRRGVVMSVRDVVGIAILVWVGAMDCLHDPVLRRIAQGWRWY